MSPWLTRTKKIFNFSYALLSYSINTKRIYSNFTHIKNAIRWLCLAQDSTNDRGVSEGYHLYHGWLPSYPETTGYIIETFFDYFHKTHDETIKNRALQMADWLVAIQNNDGSFTDSYFSKKMVFDTGQIIFGLSKAYLETKLEKYKSAAHKAGEWVVEVQEQDGSWQKHAAGNIQHAYYTRVAWSLLQLYSITQESKYIDACIKNITWAINQQIDNGWFDNASFSLINHNKPYTHTIAYTIRGILEVGVFLKEAIFITSAKKAIDNLAKSIHSNGYLFGTYDSQWKGDRTFSCLTGNAQLAISFFKLAELNNSDYYLNIGRKINQHLKSRQNISTNNLNIKGAIAGSQPIWGKYMHYCFPNWATKFFVDSLLQEEKHDTLI